MLKQFLPSVTKHSALKDCETVVADNGSTDHSIAVLDKHFKNTVRVVRFDKNYGFAEGYNKALEETEAEYTVLLNSDVEVTEGWLDTLLDYMDQHPETAACQPKIRSYNDKPYFEHAGAAGGYLDRYGYPYCRGRILSNVEEDKGQYDTTADIFWATGACMCVRTRIYKECGGLDAGFFAHMEEIDLCWRMQCRGYKIACVPQATVYHLGGGALSYENPRKTYLNFRNNLLMLYKNLPTIRLTGVMAMRAVLDYIAAAQMFAAGKKDNAKAVIEARRDYHKLKKQYKAKREENRRLAKVSYPETISSHSILFDYYLLGKRTYAK